MTHTAPGKKHAEILLIEDNYGDVLLTSKILHQMPAPHTITVAVDGEQALSMLRKEDKYSTLSTPDVILLDINLPKYNGLDLLSTIKSDASLQDIPVIMLTSSRMEKDVFTSYNLHAADYVVKPENPERFGDILRAVQAVIQ